MTSLRHLHPGRLWNRFPVLTFLAIGILLWELGAFLVDNSGVRSAATMLPYPHDVAIGAYQEGSLLASSLWITARGALVGLLFGTVLGIIIGAILAQARWIENATYPYIVGGQMIPTIALAPILLVVLRDATVTRITVATYITFFPISLGTLKGLKSTPQPAIDLMKSINANRRDIFRKVRVPEALPLFFAGFKIAAPLAVVGEIVVELTGATSGLGYTILVTQYYGPQYAHLFWSAMLLTLLLGLLFYVGAAALERLVSPWQAEFRDRLSAEGST